MLVLRVGLRTISHEADGLKAALRPITARQRVKLAADWLDKPVVGGWNWSVRQQKA